MFAITAILQMINGFNSYAINEAVYYYTPLIFIIVYSQISEEQDVETILNYLFVLYIIAFFKEFCRAAYSCKFKKHFFCKFV